MRKIAALALLGFALMPAPAWSQANLRPDPTPRVPPQPGQAIPMEDALFLKEALAASQGQVELGRLAAGKASDGALKGVATEIAETHARLAEHLKHLTHGRALPPADQVKPEQADRFGAAGAVTDPANIKGGMVQEALKSLSGANGEAFSKSYVETQIPIHDRLVDLYQTEASNTPDRELATYAITSLVAIQKNRDALRRMAGQLGIPAPANGQAIQYGDPTKAR